MLRQATVSKHAAARVLVALGLAGAAALFLAILPFHRDYFDLGVYYGSITRWLHGDGGLYEYLHPPVYLGFTYPPFAALAMSPLAVLSWQQAVAISLLLTVGAAGLLLYWLVDPVAVRQGWTRWFAFAVAGCLLAVYEPMRDTVSLGQVNILLLALVLADARLLRSGNRFAGVLIGLAAAVKLTPAIFIGYLLLTRRWRAAAVAAGTAAGASALAAAVAPAESWFFWTEALWDTDRVGSLSYVSNQSLLGALARLHHGEPPRGAWLLLVAAIIAVWVYRVRRAAATGNDLAGFALTGVTACLISPITWVHHLVWLVPALALLVGAGLAARGPRRRRLLAGAVAAYVLLCSSIVWLWRSGETGVIAFAGSNTYVWITMALLLTTPTTREQIDERGWCDHPMECHRHCRRLASPCRGTRSA